MYESGAKFVVYFKQCADDTVGEFGKKEIRPCFVRICVISVDWRAMLAAQVDTFEIGFFVTKIEEESHLFTCGLEVGHGLDSIQAGQFGASFEFYDDFIRHENIEYLSAYYPFFVVDGVVILLYTGDAQPNEVAHHGFLVNIFGIGATEAVVDIVVDADDFSCEVGVKKSSGHGGGGKWNGGLQVRGLVSVD